MIIWLSRARLTTIAARNRSEAPTPAPNRLSFKYMNNPLQSNGTIHLSKVLRRLKSLAECGGEACVQPRSQ